MANDKDGGPAFPVPTHPSIMIESYGMSLRDYFAGMAMRALVGDHEGMAVRADMLAGDQDVAENVSRHAYLMADAMLGIRGE